MKLYWNKHSNESEFFFEFLFYIHNHKIYKNTSQPK